MENELEGVTSAPQELMNVLSCGGNYEEMYREDRVVIAVQKGWDLKAYRFESQKFVCL